MHIYKNENEKDDESEKKEEEGKKRRGGAEMKKTGKEKRGLGLVKFYLIDNYYTWQLSYRPVDAGGDGKRYKPMKNDYYGGTTLANQMLSECRCNSFVQ